MDNPIVCDKITVEIVKGTKYLLANPHSATGLPANAYTCAYVVKYLEGGHFQISSQTLIKYTFLRFTVKFTNVLALLELLDVMILGFGGDKKKSVAKLTINYLLGKMCS